MSNATQSHFGKAASGSKKPVSGATGINTKHIARRRVMSARNGTSAQISSTQRGTIVSGAGSNQRNNNSNTLTAQSNTQAGSATAATNNKRIRQGFVSLNQPSMVSDAMATPAPDEQRASEIIEESSHPSKQEAEGQTDSELKISKLGQIEFNQQATDHNNKDLSRLYNDAQIYVEEAKLVDNFIQFHDMQNRPLSEDGIPKKAARDDDQSQSILRGETQSYIT